MPTTYLDLTDLDDRIKEFEQKWNLASLEMLTDSTARKEVPEHVLLRWETYVRQRIQLRKEYEERQGGYLSQIPRTSAPGHAVTSREQSELAA